MPSISYIPMNVWSPTNGFGYKLARKEVTFAATPIGDEDLFTVTGTVIIRLLAVVDTSITGAATTVMAVGCAGEETNIIGGYTLATDLDAGDIWRNDTPDSECEDLSVLVEKIISDGNTIILYYKTDAVDDGVINFYCFWTPVSAGASVVAAA